jgi:hypothetical protein
MKTKITFLGLALGSLFASSQTVADFESFTLAPNSAYGPTVSTPFQTGNAVFQYEWDNSFGGYWSEGFAYTNKQDSVNGTYTNLYGVRALKGFSNSATYAVGKDGGVIRLKSPFDKVEGFYITNTTYAWKEIVKGSTISRRFGDTTGTHSPTTTPQGSYPDYFKVTAKGFKNGTMKQDSAVFFLADYRFSNNAQDYAVNTWQWFNTSSLGSVDSIKFFMYSSDVGSFGMNTPAFFALDNFSTTAPNPVSITSNKSIDSWQVFPNPFNNQVLVAGTKEGIEKQMELKDVSGKLIYSVKFSSATINLDLEVLTPGIYFLEIKSGEEKSVKRIVKN